MDIDISLVEDCTRLAKQCKMEDFIEEMENKCKQLYEFGKKALLVQVPTKGLTFSHFSYVTSDLSFCLSSHCSVQQARNLC